MWWINKRNKKYRKKAHFIINRFIRNAWSPDVGGYVNFNYDSFKRNRHFKALLYHEQEGYCCYCMRKMKLSESHLCTIEHILPHKLGEDARNEMAFYYTYVPFFSKYVRIFNDGMGGRRLRRERPYPHFCAYENLVLSCSGAIYRTDKPDEECLSNLHECCNNKRGQKRIVPFFFMRNTPVKYEKDGLMTYDDKISGTIDALNLEGNVNLRTIRRIWANIVFRTRYTLADVKSALESPEQRDEILLGTDLDRNSANRFKNKLYWRLLIEYEWFEKYFRSQRKKG